MNLRFASLLITSLLLSGCATITGSMTDEPIQPDPQGRTMGEVIDDKNLRTRLLVNLEKLDERYKDANIDIQINAGIVLLVGQVPTENLISEATKLLKSDSQVKAIHNHLTAEPNISTGLKANDKWLSVKTRSRMFTTDYFPSSNIDIVVEKGIVYLLGRVTQETAEQAVQIASEVNGVQKVVMVFQIIP
ncbi:BON domain-containing protein [Reinekea sp. G2M2-21]|uniref:BON domain-containing protein n=1 Tax=Reinekea sp. G2M2-21 TaxID=2788942 RepID=UPI0018AA8D64|nr:BON domain-containing protein [Reinekea sp. G2M2-21]